jgi:hypothetical protein
MEIREERFRCVGRTTECTFFLVVCDLCLWQHWKSGKESREQSHGKRKEISQKANGEKKNDMLSWGMKADVNLVNAFLCVSYMSVMIESSSPWLFVSSQFRVFCWVRTVHGIQNLLLPSISEKRIFVQTPHPSRFLDIMMSCVNSLTRNYESQKSLPMQKGWSQGRKEGFHSWMRLRGVSIQRIV